MTREDLWNQLNTNPIMMLPILLFDPNSAAAAVLTLQLRRAGFETHMAEDGSAAVLAARGQHRLPVGAEGSDAPIIDVNAPSHPIGALIGIFGYNDIAGFVTVDSYPDNNGNVIENVDSSLRSAPGYDNVTGRGSPRGWELANSL